MTLKESRKNEQALFLSQGKKAIKKLFSKEWYTQIPNLLTASRGIAPLVVLPLALTGNMVGAITAEVLFASTDFLDGLIARKFNLYSDFGKKLDTVCDKIFAINLLIPILLICPSIGINICFEIIIAAINSISMIKGNNPKSSMLGKTKTLALSVTIILSYLSIFTPVSETLLNMAMALTTLLQGTAAFDYYLIDKIKDIHKEKDEINNIEEQRQEENEQQKSKNKDLNDKVITNEIYYQNNFPKENDNPKTYVKTKKKV